MTPPPSAAIRPASTTRASRAARRRRVAGCLLVVALAVTGGCARNEPRQAILILLDAARPDRFSSYGYGRPTTPRLDELAERGVVLRNHFTQYTFTRSSIPSLLYSRYFSVPVFPRTTDIMLAQPESLFRVPDAESISLPRALSAAGLRTTLISAHSWFRAGTRIEREFDELHDLSTELKYPPKYGAPRAEQVIDFAIDWLAEHRRDDYFLYLHLMDTHFPHFFEEDAKFFEPDLEPSPDLERKFTIPGRRQLAARSEPLSTRERAYLDAMYDGSLRYSDRHLGRLVDHLRSTRALDRTLIMITSDHGEHLLESPGRFEHGGPWLELVARVPMIVFYPNRLTHRTLDVMTENVDLLPTTLGLLEVDLPAGKRPDGQDLTGALSGEPFTREHAFGRSAVRSPRYKAVFHQKPEELFGVAEAVSAPGGRLYDLESDPGELRDLWHEKPEAANRLMEVYVRKMKAPFLRFWESTSDDQAQVRFAVGAGHFEPQGEVTEEWTTLRPEERRAPADRQGWYLSNQRRMFALIAARGAEPLTISFPVPDGLYALTLGMRGSARLELPGLPEPVEVSTEPLAAETQIPYGEPIPTEEVAAGVVEVRERRFQARLDPRVDDSLFAVRYFGFEPLGGDLEKAVAEDEELRERLRTLGYVD